MGIDPATARLMRAARGVRKLLFLFVLVAAGLTAAALSVSEPGRLYVAARFAWFSSALAALALLAINLAAIWAWGRGRRGGGSD